MAKPHGARQQKRLAKQKAKRSEKRAAINRRESKDPSIRLQGAERWPVVQAFMGSRIWADGLGSLVIARQESAGQLVFGVFLVDVNCLGVKNAFWRAGSQASLRELIGRMEETQEMSPVAPECLVKLVKGAVEYARSFGFLPHPDYRHAAMLLEGIDPATCRHDFTFGRDGKPYYVQGPNESFSEVENIMMRVRQVGGNYLVRLPVQHRTLFDAEDSHEEFERSFDEEYDVST